MKRATLVKKIFDIIEREYHWWDAAEDIVGMLAAHKIVTFVDDMPKKNKLPGVEK